MAEPAVLRVCAESRAGSSFGSRYNMSWHRTKRAAIRYGTFFLVLTCLWAILHAKSFLGSPAEPNSSPVFAVAASADPAPQCLDIHSKQYSGLSHSEQCEFIRNFCKEKRDLGYFNYLDGYYCGAGSFRSLVATAYGFILFLFFLGLGIAASDYLCPNLNNLATMFGMSETLAGVTMLALGNGSPDLVSTYEAMNAGSASLAIGELVGAAAFITSVVIGSMAIAREFDVTPLLFTRDLLFFLILISFSLYFISDGLLRTWECVTMICFYVGYVAVIIVLDRTLEDPEKDLEDRMLAVEASAHQLLLGDGRLDRAVHLSDLEALSEPLGTKGEGLNGDAGIGSSSRQDVAVEGVNGIGEAGAEQRSRIEFPSSFLHPEGTERAKRAEQTEQAEPGENSAENEPHLDLLEVPERSDDYFVAPLPKFRSSFAPIQPRSHSNTPLARTPSPTNMAGPEIQQPDKEYELPDLQSQQSQPPEPSEPQSQPQSQPYPKRPVLRVLQNSDSSTKLLREGSIVGNPLYQSMSYLARTQPSRSGDTPADGVASFGQGGHGRLSNGTSDAARPLSDVTGDAPGPAASIVRSMTLGTRPSHRLSLVATKFSVLDGVELRSAMEIVRSKNYRDAASPLATPLEEEEESQPTGSASSYWNHIRRLGSAEPGIITEESPSGEDGGTGTGTGTGAGKDTGTSERPDLLAPKPYRPPLFVTDSANHLTGGPRPPRRSIPHSGTTSPSTMRSPSFFPTTFPDDLSVVTEEEYVTLADTFRYIYRNRVYHDVTLVKLFPTLINFRDKGIGAKILSVLQAPIVFVFSLCIPTFDCVGTPGDATEVGEAGEAGETEYCNYDGAPINNSEEWYQYVKEYWCFLLLQGAVCPFIIVKVLFPGSDYEDTALVVAVVTGILLDCRCLYGMHLRRKVRYPVVINALGFVISMCWIFVIAQEVVSMLETLGVILNLSDTLLGLSVFTFGNSLGDFVANVTFAQMGLPIMALSACFGGPMLNVLIGVGVSGLIVLYRNEDLHGVYKIDIPITLFVSGFALIFNLLFLLVAVWRNQWRVSKSIGIVCVGIWCASLAVNLYIELELKGR